MNETLGTDSQPTPQTITATPIRTHHIDVGTSTSGVTLAAACTRSATGNAQPHSGQKAAMLVPKKRNRSATRFVSEAEPVNVASRCVPAASNIDIKELT